eukprot:SAG11_NODE_13027_length_673_cov_1.714286_1_plen_28_part_10
MTKQTAKVARHGTHCKMGLWSPILQWQA